MIDAGFIQVPAVALKSDEETKLSEGLLQHHHCYCQLRQGRRSLQLVPYVQMPS